VSVSVHRQGDVGVHSARNGCPGCRNRPVGCAGNALAPRGPQPLQQGRATPGACARAPTRVLSSVLDGGPYDLKAAGNSPALCSPARAIGRKHPARSPVALNSTNLPIIVGSSFVPAHGCRGSHTRVDESVEQTGRSPGELPHRQTGHAHSGPEQ
jgi:hypothetical protein